MHAIQANPLDLSLANWQGILLAAIPAVFNIIIFIYILAYLPNRRMTRSYALFTLALVFWQVNDVFARMCTTAETAAFWDDIFCTGWIFVGPIGLYFTLLYIRKESLATSTMAMLLIFLPALFFESIFKANLFDHVYTYRGIWGWVDDHNTSMLDGIMILWITVLVLVMLVLMIRHAIWLDDGFRRRQTILIAIGLGIPVIQGAITQGLWPVLLHRPAIPATSTFMSFFTLATAIALSKYRLFSLTENLNTERILHYMRDLVLAVSPQRRIVYINRYGIALLGMNPKNSESFSLDELFPQVNGIAEEFMRGVLDPALAGESVNNFSTKMKRKNGEAIDVLVNAVPIRSGRQIEGVLVVARNITEIKKAEAKLQEKNLMLERTNEELESFAFMASHDMKEPIRMVSNYTGLLAKRYGDVLGEEGKEYVRFAVEGVQRMQRLINDLLNYSGIGKEKLQWTRVDCNQLIEELRHDLQMKLTETRAAILHDELPTVFGVHSLLCQLFQNLIENAIKFRRKDIDPVIAVSARKDGDSWLFCVKDNGIGIPQEYGNKVFDLFKRLHTQQEYPGTGIGLSICKKIVEMHGGEIWIESQQGEGTSFFFTLPDRKERNKAMKE